MMSRKKLFRCLRWTAAAVLGLLGATVGILWLMFQHIPGWYHPAQIPREDNAIQRVKNDLVRTQEVLSEWLVNVDEPFQHRFTAEQINAWLAIREDIWPLAREWLPPEFSDPCIYMDEQDLRLAVTYRKGDLRTVLTLSLEAHADEDGIHLRIREISAGSLTIPRSWIERELARLDDGRWPAGTLLPYQSDDRPLPKLTELHEGAEFPNAWESWNVKRRFRIIGLQFEPSAMVVTIEPLPRRLSAR